MMHRLLPINAPPTSSNPFVFRGDRWFNNLFWELPSQSTIILNQSSIHENHVVIINTYWKRKGINSKWDRREVYQNTFKKLGTHTVSKQRPFLPIPKNTQMRPTTGTVSTWCRPFIKKYWVRSRKLIISIMLYLIKSIKKVRSRMDFTVKCDFIPRGGMLCIASRSFKFLLRCSMRLS